MTDAFLKFPPPLDARWIRPRDGRPLKTIMNGYFPEGTRNAEIGHVATEDGCHLFRTRGIWREMATVLANMHEVRPTLSFRIPLLGKTKSSSRSGRTYLEFEEEPGSSYIRTHDDTNSAITHFPGEESHVLVAIFTADMLNSLLDSEPLPQHLQRFITHQDDHFATAVRSSSSVTRITTEILDNPYQGRLGEIYLQAKTSELLVSTMSDILDNASQSRSLSATEQIKTDMARDIILSNLASPPSVGELAAQVRVSQRHLNKLFIERYGMNVFACIVKWRLDYGRSLLARGELSLKEIAFQLGYRHPSNFSLAFAKTFGYPPGQYKRKSVHVIKFDIPDETVS